MGGQSHLWMASHAVLMQISKYFLSALFYTLFPTLGFAEKGPLPPPPKSAIWSIMVMGVWLSYENHLVCLGSVPGGSLAQGLRDGSVAASDQKTTINVFWSWIELEQKSKPFLPPISRVLWGQWPLLSDLANPWQISKIKRSARIHFWPFQYCSAIIDVIKDNISFHEFVVSNW